MDFIAGYMAGCFVTGAVVFLGFQIGRMDMLKRRELDGDATSTAPDGKPWSTYLLKRRKHDGDGRGEGSDY